MMNDLMPTYAPISDLSLEYGKGCFLWDNKGKSYFDAIGGVGVTLLGHSDSGLREEISDQLNKYIHLSNLFDHKWNHLLAKRLKEISGLDTSFFCNSGSEANETAIKIARRYGQKKGIRHPKIVHMKNSFHGRTLGALSATGNPKHKEGFGALLSDFIEVEINKIEQIYSLEHTSIAAIILEPIQGEGGINIVCGTYLRALRKYCSEKKILLILDEVQCGLARTGKWFYHQFHNIKPDILTTAKGLANGIPIGACVARREFGALLERGSHGSTFGGNPLACRAALYTLNKIEEKKLLENAALRGEQLLNGLQAKFSHINGICSIRGCGLMIGIELETPYSCLAKVAAHKYQLLINVTKGTIIRLLPPLIIDQYEVEKLVEKLEFLIKDIIGNNI